MDLSNGIKEIWKQDEEFQNVSLKIIVERIRKVADNDLAMLTIEDLRNAGMFYVPSHEYLLKFYGDDILSYKYGIYCDGYCSLYQRLAIPMTFIDGTVGGFIGYSNSNDEGEEQSTATSVLIKYLYPPKHIMDKSRYLYLTREEYIKAIKDGYICIVDGIFDKRRLQSIGINAVSLCGSALTDWHLRYLSFIKHKIVVADNDSAGRKLVGFCQYKMPGTIEIKQGDAWDVDDFLKTKENIDSFLETFETVKKGGFLTSAVVRGTYTMLFGSDNIEKDSGAEKENEGKAKNNTQTNK